MLYNRDTHFISSLEKGIFAALQQGRNLTFPSFGFAQSEHQTKDISIITHDVPANT
jgi:hypothetical protein